MTSKQKLLHLTDILNSRVWIECAAKARGTLPGETLVDSKQREYDTLRHSLRSDKPFRLRCNMADVESFNL